ncbi:MAG: DNA-binding transcriptional regulator [Tannerella sp.]|nr:DNA-binding transcriptional regulator [Tannerella sp.]
MKKILLLTDFSSGYSRSLLRGIVRYSKEHGPWAFYRMPLFYRELYGDDGVIKWATEWKADAVIAQLEHVDLDKLNRLKIPVIIQNYKERADKVCNITGDYFKTGEMAANFFLSRGFLNFAYYGYKEMIWSRERADGYRSRIEDCGYALSMLNNNKNRDEHWSSNLPVLGNWLLSLPKPVALFACDDTFALQVTETCRIHNITVPDEVAVLGVDNDELICNISDPPLSSIVLDVENGGFEAAGMLHQLMDGQICRTFDIVIPPLRIETRQSTGEFATEDKYVLKVIAYIKEHFAGPVSTNDLLRIVPFSRRVLEIKFRKETGISVYQYLLKYRIEQFAELLIKTNRPLTELATVCGFEDYRNVARIFYKYKKNTPLQYRNRYKCFFTV